MEESKLGGPPIQLISDPKNDTNLIDIISNSDVGNIITFKSELDIYNNKDYIVVYVDKDIAIFKQTDTKKIIRLDLNNLNTNQYGIIGIMDEYIIENILESPSIIIEPNDLIESNIEIESNDFNESNGENIGEDIFIRELGIYERNYSYYELKESLINSLKETLYKKKKSIYTYNYLDNKSEKLLQLMTNKNLYISKKPIINKFINNNYDYLIKPIIDDIKKIYTISQELLDLNNSDENQFSNIYFANFTDEMLGTQELNMKYYKNNIDRNQYFNNLENNYEYKPENEETIYDLKSINRPYFNNNNMQNNYYTTINTKNSNKEIYRMCNPDNICYSILEKSDRDKMIQINKLSTRRLEPSNYIFKDILSDRFISDRNSSGLPTSVCHGTGKVPEFFYSGKNNKAQHKISDFNKTILEPTTKINISEGEEINIIGILINSIYSYKPEFTNNIYDTYDGNSDNNGYTRIIQFPEINNIGHDLVDQILINNDNIDNPLKNKNQIINNIQLHDDMSILKMDTIDYTKNNFVYFNKNNNIKLENIENHLNNIIPDINKIYQIENKLKNCLNFNDIDSILNKYNLSIYNSNIIDIRNLNIKEQLIYNIDKIIFINKYNHLLKIASKNKEKIYREILNIINSNIRESDILLYPQFNHEFIDQYKQLIINKTINKISDNLRYQYSLDILENITINKFKINFNYSNISLSDDEKYKELLYYIISLIYKNKYNLFYYENRYLYNIINYKKIFDQEDINIMNIIYKIYNISFSDFKQNYINLNNIQLIQNLKKSFDGGKLLYSFYDNIISEKTLYDIQSELLNISEIKYLEQPIQPNKSWGNLTIEEQLNNIPDINEIESELELLKKNFKNQQKRYNFYLKRCECFEIVKIYNSIEDIRIDNRKSKVYYSKEFDTSLEDIILAKKLLNNINEINNKKGKKNTNENSKNFLDILRIKLEYIYILDSENEINNKIRNIKQNWNNDIIQRQIVDNEYALLNNTDSRILYKYKNNIWIPLGEKDIITSNICLFEKSKLEKIMDIDFDYLVYNGSNKLRDELEKNNNILNLDDRKCIKIDNKCVPKHFYNFVYNINKLSIYKENLSNLLNNKDNLENHIQENKTYVMKKIKIYEQIKLKDTKNNINIKIPKKNIPERLLILYKNAINLVDPDLRLDAIKNVIDNYGILYKPNDNNTKTIDNNIYWDYPNTIKILCCKHYLDLIKMAWIDNNSRLKILEEIKIKWCKNRNIEGENIYCDNCGEPLDKIGFSSFEGFSGNDKPIRIREEIFDDDYAERYTNFIGEKADIESIIKQYTIMLGFELSQNDNEFIVNNAYNSIKSRNITLDEYLKGKTHSINIGKFKENKPEGQVLRENYSLGYELYIENKNIIDINDLLYAKTIANDKTINKNDREYQLKLFCRFLLKNIIFNYQVYINSQKISIILSYLYLVIIYSVPPYNIKGNIDERVSKISFFSFNEENEKANIKFLIKDITGNFINKNKNNYIEWETLKKVSYKKLTSSTSLYNEFYERNFEIEYIEIKNIPIIELKKELKLNYNLELEKTYKHIINQDNIWSEFRPLLVVNYDYNLQINIDDSITIYKEIYNNLYNLDNLDNNNINQLQQRLVEIKRTILDESRKLGFKLISSINKSIHETFRTNTLPRISYLSSCCRNSISTDYMDYFYQLENRDEFKDIIYKINQSNDFFDHSFDIKLLPIVFNKYNTIANHEQVQNIDLTSRKLLDYMYISRNFFKNNEEYTKYLKNTILEINNIIVTDIFINNVNISIIGQNRLWTEYNDPDINIIDKIYINASNKDNYKPNNEELNKLLYNELTDKYSDFSEDYIRTKIDIILNYNGKTLLDIVSGQYKHNIDKFIYNYIDGKSNEELLKIIENLDTKKRISNILINTNVYKQNYIKNQDNIYNSYKNEVIIIQKIKNLIKNLFNRPDMDEYYRSIKRIIQKNDFNDLKKNMLGIHNDYFGKTNLNDLIINNFDENSYRKIISNKLFNLDTKLGNIRNKNITPEIIEKILDDIGKTDNTEELIELEERLTVEGYIIGSIDREKEKDFRTNLIKNKNNSKKIKTINEISKQLLYILSSIKNKVVKTKTYNEQFQKYKIKNKNKTIISIDNKNIWWLSNINIKKNVECKCPIKNKYINDEIFEENYHITYDYIDELLKNIMQNGGVDELNLDFVNIEKLLELINLLVNKSNKNDCKNNIEYTPILNTENIQILSNYVLYNLLYMIFINLEDTDLNTNIKLGIYYFIFYQNILKSSPLYFENTHIINIINNYNSKKNRQRKNNIDAMEPEMRNSYKLYRKLNLGDIFETDEKTKINVFNEEEEYFNAGNDVHNNLEQQNIQETIGEDIMNEQLYNEELDNEAFEENFYGEDNNDGNSEFIED